MSLLEEGIKWCRVGVWILADSVGLDCYDMFQDRSNALYLDVQVSIALDKHLAGKWCMGYFAGGLAYYE